MLLAVAAAAIAAEKIRPWAAGQVGYDSAASVLYFDRIISGRQLESFVSATPKALLTVVYGLLHSLTGDWRPISALAVLVFGINVALAAVLARRLAGPVAAGFAAVGFIGSVALLEDASAAYAVGWAVLGWLVAGLALTSERPRYAVAAIALMLAGLARFETLLLAGTAAILIVGGMALSRRWPALRPPHGSWILLLSLGALPLQMLHDWLLTGDAFWAEGVPAIVSQSIATAGPFEILRTIIYHNVSMGPLVILAAIGAIRIVIDRRWSIAVGLAVIGPGIWAFLLFLAYRHIYFSARYLYPGDIAVLFTAAVGIASVRVPVLETLRIPPGMARRGLTLAPRAMLALLAGGVMALALVKPYAPLDRALGTKIHDNLALFENEAAVLPALRSAVGGIPGVRDWPAAASPLLRVGQGTILLVPVLLGPRMSVDLNMPLSRISAIGTPKTDGTNPSVGQFVYHDPRNDLPAAEYKFLEVPAATTIGAIRLVPVEVNATRRYWLLRVDAP